MELLIKLSFGIILMATSIHSCFNSNELILEKEAVNLEKINIDGYFYAEKDFGSFSFFLFKDGTYLYIGGKENCSSFDCIDEFIRESTRMNHDQSVYKLKYHWGIYSIDSNKINIKRYQGIGFASYRVQEINGEIADSTTIILKRGERYDNYRLHPYYPKPDSTNNFIDYR